ncbi:MAG: conserved phage C-terminal domain-containing protein [Candidatus Cloacimonetes bacterium]|nr:conserved phage C-terminal domain-containing protein [Candidatus Cloacimonadota bacterium]MDY0367565.1 conserved phage C-terminal domain-containing protein [Candidatus Syntrophosphaera sp.]
MAEIKELWIMARELLGQDELSRRFRGWIRNLIRTARVKQSSRDSWELDADDAQVIIKDLNDRTKSKFSLTDNAQVMISKLLRQGYTVQDFIRVHEIKTTQWWNDEKMKNNLRPSTLYRQSHFDEYLGEWHRQEAERAELAAKRAKQQTAAPARAAVKQAERDAVVSELNARAWHDFESWGEFMRWTLRFPDASSLNAYLEDVPSRLRAMRTAPRMGFLAATKNCPDGAKTEYLKLKKEHAHGTVQE